MDVFDKLKLDTIHSLSKENLSNQQLRMIINHALIRLNTLEQEYDIPRFTNAEIEKEFNSKT